MHELSIAQDIVGICVERAQGQAVRRVTLEVGALAAVLPEAIGFCFEMCALGTPLEGAELDIIQVPGLGRCRECGLTVPMPDYLTPCRCGAAGLECIRGGRLTVKTLEIH